MLLYKLDGSREIQGVKFPHKSCVISNNGAFIVAWEFNRKQLEVAVFDPATQKWFKTILPSEDKYAILLRKKSEEGKQKYSFKYANYMKHSRKKKRATGGTYSRFSGTLTDYECAKEPLHDFRRAIIYS